MLISILINVQYLQNDVFHVEKGLDGQIQSSSKVKYAQNLIKKSIPSKNSHSPSTRVDFLPLPLNAIWKALISDISRVFFGIALITQQMVTC